MMVAEVSHEVDKPNLAHSKDLHLPSTTAADDGASAQQLISFYGWKSVNMPNLEIQHFPSLSINQSSFS